MNKNNKTNKINSIKKTSRFVGYVYLIVILTGLFSEMVVKQSLVVTGDATATAMNIMASAKLFKFGIMSDIVFTMGFFTLGFLFYL